MTKRSRDHARTAVEQVAATVSRVAALRPEALTGGGLALRRWNDTDASAEIEQHVKEHLLLIRQISAAMIRKSDVFERRAERAWTRSGSRSRTARTASAAGSRAATRATAARPARAATTTRAATPARARRCDGHVETAVSNAAAHGVCRRTVRRIEGELLCSLRSVLQIDEFFSRAAEPGAHAPRLVDLERVVGRAGDLLVDHPVAEVLDARAGVRTALGDHARPSRCLVRHRCPRTGWAKPGVGRVGHCIGLGPVGSEPSEAQVTGEHAPTAVHEVPNVGTVHVAFSEALVVR